MSVSRISSRYAKSLLDLARERNELDTVLKDIESFNEATKNRDFFLLLKSPIVKTDKKLAIFKAIFEGTHFKHIDVLIHHLIPIFVSEYKFYSGEDIITIRLNVSICSFVGNDFFIWI